MKNRSMRLKDPKQFNDPFELSPRFPADSVMVEEMSRLYCSEESIQMHLDKIADDEEANLEQAREKYLKALDHSFLNTHAVETARFALMESFAQNARLLCCSTSPENILMWSHYGEQHRGLVLEIETNNFCDEERFAYEILKVDYDPVRPLMTELGLNGETSEGFFRDARQSLKTKAEFWRYEQEVRILIPLFQGMRNVDGHYELPFEPEAIRSVTLGCASHLASEFQFEESIKEVLKDPAYAHLEQRKAYIHRDDFKLVFDVLKH